MSERQQPSIMISLSAACSCNCCHNVEQICWQLENELEADQKHTEFVESIVDSEERTHALEQRIADISQERNASELAMEKTLLDVESARNFFETLNSRTTP